MSRHVMAALIALLVLLCVAALFLAAPARGAEVRERPAASWWLIPPCDPNTPPTVRVEPAGHGEAWAWCPGYGGPGVVGVQGDWGAVWVDGRLLYGRTWLVEVWRP